MHDYYYLVGKRGYFLNKWEIKTVTTQKSII
jgi:hypothetical protein